MDLGSSELRARTIAGGCGVEGGIAGRLPTGLRDAKAGGGRACRRSPKRCPLPPSLIREPSEVPCLSRSPPTPALISAKPRREGPRSPRSQGKGALRRRTGQLPGGLTSALPAAAGAGPGRVRARPAHPPAAELSWAPSAPALRPPVSKLLNLRAAHALRGRRPTRRIGPPGQPGSALLSTVPTRAIRAGLSARAGALRCASAPPELPAGRGASPRRARGRESPPLFSPTPEPAPLPGIRSKKRTGAPGLGVRRPPPARPCPQLGRCARSAGLATAPLVWTLAQSLCPASSPSPTLPPRRFQAARAPAQLQASWGQNRPVSLPKPQFPIRSLESDKDQAPRESGVPPTLSSSQQSTLQSIFPVPRKCDLQGTQVRTLHWELVQDRS